MNPFTATAWARLGCSPGSGSPTQVLKSAMSAGAEFCDVQLHMALVDVWAGELGDTDLEDDDSDDDDDEVWNLWLVKVGWLVLVLLAVIP